jgi:hypothetical protein
MSINDRVPQSSSDFVDKPTHTRSKFAIHIDTDSESDEPPPLSGKENRATFDDEDNDDEADDEDEDKGSSSGVGYATAEVVPAPSTTAADSSSLLHRNATAEIVRPAPSGGAPSASAPSYPRSQAIMICDREGNDVGETMVEIKRPWHEPTYRAEPGLIHSVVLILTDNGAELTVTTLELACAYLNWANRDLADVVQKRMSNHGVTLASFSSRVGLRDPKDLAYYLCSELSLAQNTAMCNMGSVQIDHRLHKRHPMFLGGGANAFFAQNHFSNLLPLDAYLNEKVKSAHNVEGDMVPISEAGTVIAPDQWYRNGETDEERFKIFKKDPTAPLSFSEQTSKLWYEERKAEWERVVGDMENQEYLQSIRFSVENQMSKSNFSIQGMQAIIEQHGQEVIDILKMHADPETDIPTLESLLQKRQQLHAMGTATADVPATTNSTAASATTTQAMGAPTAAVSTSTLALTTTYASKSLAPAASMSAVALSTEGIVKEVLDKMCKQVAGQHALEFIDLRAKCRGMSQSLADRIEDCIENAPSDLDYRLVFDQCDVCSLIILARCDFARNKISVLTLERLSIAFLELLADRATASTCAKNVVRKVIKKKKDNATKKLEQSVVDANLFGQTPSQALQILDKAAESKKTGDDEDDDDDEEEKNPYHEAADSAAKEAGSKKKWFDLARFSQKTLLQLRRCILQKVICVVMQLTCFRKVAEKVIASRPFLNEHVPNWQDKNLMCAQAFDESIGPLLQNAATVEAACELVWGIATQLSATEFAGNFEKAGSLPLNQQFEGCDIDQCLKKFRALGVKSYFSQRQSRLAATRTMLVPVAFTAAIQRIQDGYDLSRCVYGVNCLAPSLFHRGKKYKLLYDETDKLIQRKYEHRREIMTIINNLCGEYDAALEVFQNDYLVMDLTADIKNNTDKSLRRLNEYLNLCLQGTSDVDGRDIEAVPI